MLYANLPMRSHQKIMKRKSRKLLMIERKSLTNRQESISNQLNYHWQSIDEATSKNHKHPTTQLK